MRPRVLHGLAAGAVVLAVALAAPAIGARGSDHGKQPPPGTVAHSPVHVAPVAKQPTRVTHAPLKLAPVPKQPVNRHPQKSTGIKLGKQLRHSKHDKGVKGLKQRPDHGKKNLPPQKG